ncbi:MAG TPA: DinB family protein [Thermoanaerobaculia bacterium]
MSTREFFAERLAAELPAFKNVIRALPGDRLDYRPHEKNSSAGQIAWQLAVEMSQVPDLFRTGEIDWIPAKGPESIDEISDTFARNADAALAAAKSVDEERWNAPAKFKWKGEVAWETTVSDMAWGYLFDMVHHRGQLTAYLRPMGGKVPACYGPTADDKG